MRHLSALLFVCLLVSFVPVYAQEPPDTGVTVTTQDIVSLRTGPGTDFERIAIIDPGVTLPAIGRSAAGDWVQVWYAGQHGWIAAWLLVWVGDLVSLPVDGVDPAPYVRRPVAEGVTTRETPLYARQITPEDQVGTLPAGTPVEITGRLGSRGMYQLQIQYEGELYWVGSWNIRITGGNEARLFDTSYLYAFGRLLNQLSRDISRNSKSLSSIEQIWLRLRDGDSVSCALIPAYAERDASDSDVAGEPLFAPLVSALDAGINSTNAAISGFADACGREDDFFLTQQDVKTALDHIENARRNYNIASSLLASLRHRDPLLGDEE